MADEAEQDPNQAPRDEFRSGLAGELTPDQELGARRAQTAFNGPDTTIKKAYEDLLTTMGSEGDDAALFGEYLITNLKLHFDTMEEELSDAPEPTTPSYEEEMAGQEEAPLPPEEALGAPPEAGMPPMPPGPEPVM